MQISLFRWRATPGLIAALLLTACATTPPPPPSGAWMGFATLQLGLRTNRALACSPDICRLARATREAINLDAGAEQVAAALLRLQPTAQFRTEPSGDIRARYVAVTPLLRFCDDVDVLIRPISPQQSVVAVYSRSRIGVSDLGANGRRIRALERRLRAELRR